MSGTTFLILLAEDNPSDRILVKAALREHHIEHELIVAEDGEDAFRILDRLERGIQAHDLPDLALLDLNLPKRSGMEVLRRMKEISRLAHSPVVVISSSDSLDDRAAAARLGAAHYFRKPLEIGEFLDLGRIVRGLLAPPPVEARG